jgi:peroxiredoxin
MFSNNSTSESSSSIRASNPARLMPLRGYNHLLQQPLPRLMIEVTSHLGTQEMMLSELIGEGCFLIAFQPGASTDAEAEAKLYSQNPGAPGCTGELVALDEAAPELGRLGYEKIIVVSNKSSAQQRQVLIDRKEKLKNNAIIFISDSDLKFANVLRLYLNKDRLQDAKTGATHDITYIERVMLQGVEGIITNYSFPAEGVTPADNVKSVVSSIRDNKSRSAKYVHNLTDSAAADLAQRAMEAEDQNRMQP